MKNYCTLEKPQLPPSLNASLQQNIHFCMAYVVEFVVVLSISGMSNNHRPGNEEGEKKGDPRRKREVKVNLVFE